MGRYYYSYNNENKDWERTKKGVFSLFSIFLMISISQNIKIIKPFLEKYRGIIIGIILGVGLIYISSYLIIRLFHILRKSPSNNTSTEISNIESEEKETIITKENKTQEDFSSIRDINIFLKKAFPEIFNKYEILGISGYLRYLHPKVFEELIQLVFTIEGYEIIQKARWFNIKGKREAKKDGGIDLICKKNDNTYYIQAKNTVNQFITDDMIRNLHGSTINKRQMQDKVILITTTVLSDIAKKTASEDKIMTLEFDKFNTRLDKIYKDENHRKEIQDFFLSHTLAKEEKYTEGNRECPECGAPLIYRKNKGKTPCRGCAKFCGYVQYINVPYKQQYYTQQKQYQYH